MDKVWQELPGSYLNELKVNKSALKAALLATANSYQTAMPLPPPPFQPQPLVIPPPQIAATLGLGDQSQNKKKQKQNGALKPLTDL